MNPVVKYSIFALAVMLPLFLVASRPAEAIHLTDAFRAAEETMQHINRAVVLVKAETPDTNDETSAGGSCNGFFDSPQTIITAAHCIYGDETAYLITESGKRYDIIGVADSENDWDIIRLAVDIPQSDRAQIVTLQLATAKPMPQEEVVLVSRHNKLPEGSRRGRVLLAHFENRTGDTFATNIFSEAGMSGAPALNADGAVVGVLAGGSISGYDSSFTATHIFSARQSSALPLSIAEWQQTIENQSNAHYFKVIASVQKDPNKICSNETLVLLTEWRSADPESKLALQTTANCLYELGAFQAAIDIATTLLEPKATLGTLRVLIAAHLRLKQDEKAKHYVRLHAAEEDGVYALGFFAFEEAVYEERFEASMQMMIDLADIDQNSMASAAKNFLAPLQRIQGPVFRYLTIKAATEILLARQPSPQSRVEIARHLLQNNEAESAVLALQPLLEAYPKFEKGYFWLWLAHLYNADLLQANMVLSKLAALNLQWLRENLELFIYYVKNAPSDAIRTSALTQLLTYSGPTPLSPEASYEIGNIYYYEADDVELGAIYVQDAIARGLDYPYAQWLLWGIHYYSANFLAASETFEQAINANDLDLDDAVERISTLCTRLHDSESGSLFIQYYIDRLLQLELEARHYYQLGVSVLRNNDFEQAENLLLRALDLQPGYAKAKLYLALAQAGQQRLTSAQATFEKLLNSDKTWVDENISLPFFEQSSIDNPEAIKDFLAYLRDKLSTMESTTSLELERGKIQLTTGEYIAARSSFKRSVKIAYEQDLPPAPATTFWFAMSACNPNLSDEKIYEIWSLVNYYQETSEDPDTSEDISKWMASMNSDLSRLSADVFAYYGTEYNTELSCRLLNEHFEHIWRTSVIEDLPPAID